MKLHDYRFSPLAERDLEEIQDVLADQYPERDIKFMDKLDKVVEQLRVFPRMGRDLDYLVGYQVVMIWDYVLFYRLLKGIVTIERVLDGARDLRVAFFED